MPYSVHIQKFCRFNSLFALVAGLLAGGFFTQSVLACPVTPLAIDELGSKPAVARHDETIVCENGSAAGYPCNNVDLLSFTPLADIGGGYGNDIWGWTDPQTGKEYALMGRTQRHRVRRRHRPRQPDLPGQPADAHEQLLVARHQGVREPRVHRQRGQRPRHAGVRPDAAAQRHHAADLRQHRALQQLWQRAQHRHQRRHGFRLRRRHDPPCAGGLHMVDISNPTAPTFAGCYGADGYTHDAQCVIYSRPDLAPFPPRQRDLLQLQRRHAHDRRRHRQGQPGAARAPALFGQWLLAPGLADRGSPVFSARRRAGRTELRSHDANPTFLTSATRRSVPDRAVQQLGGGHRSQPVRQRRLRIPGQLSRGPAHSGGARRGVGRPGRRGVL